MAKETLYDILVLGGGPAGAAAALFAAAKGLKAAVVHHGGPASAKPQVEWFHPQGAALLVDGGVDSREAVLGAIDRVRFVDATCKQDVRVTIGRKIDIVDSARLTDNMLARAEEKGADRFGRRVTAIRAHEKTVSLATDGGGHFTGRLLIAADGARSLASQCFELEGETGTAPPTFCCQAVVGTLQPRPRPGAAVELTLLLDSDDLSRFGYGFLLGTALVVGTVAPASSGDPRTGFREALTRWTRAGYLPAEANPAEELVDIREVPRGLALEFDTHVGKHVLFIGDAGGYVTAVSHEGLYPAIWSAKLAVDACVAALPSKHPQDALIEFDSSWRREMADYLRPPNSDLRFLLPLIFSNKRMAEKLAEAFFFGVNL
ncbi:MAG TPA: FAD-dependent monooxygenase [Phycisphaerae bacterium]|nr:FAD-dependent monooxygenase [Phycisphaerae bacterium]